jgi:hypothetical protein
LRPEHDDPREVADRLLARLAALRFAEVLAVGAEPGELDRLAAGPVTSRGSTCQMLLRMWRVRGMVGLVHPDRFFVVVDGDIDRSAERLLDAGRRAAAAGEIVDDEAAHRIHVLTTR